MSTDEQMVQAAELIKVIRTMERVMRELDPPMLGGYLSEHYFKEELEDALLDIRLISEDLRASKFRALHETWDIRTTMAWRRDGKDGILPNVGLAYFRVPQVSKASSSVGFCRKRRELSLGSSRLRAVLDDGLTYTPLCSHVEQVTDAEAVMYPQHQWMSYTRRKHSSVAHSTS